MEAPFPHAHEEHGGGLRRLVDRETGVEAAAPDRLVPCPGDGDGRRVLVRPGAGVRRDGTRAVGVDDASEFGTDLVERRGRIDGLERAVGRATQRGDETVGVVHLVGELPTLDARVALEQRVVLHPTHGDDAIGPTVGSDVHLDRTGRVTHTAERLVRLDAAHGTPFPHKTNRPITSRSSFWS